MRSGSRKRVVVEPGLSAGEQLGNDPLVHVGVLPQVERREMKAENIDGAAQPTQPPVGQERPNR